MTRSIYLKRKYLHEYEYVQRANEETIRSFCNRYSRIERSLHSVGISVDAMYDSESRGARLLDRFRLNLDQQRLILVASGQSLEFEVIREAAQIQFPDPRPTPPVMYSKEFEGRQDGQLRHQHPGNNSGNGKGNARPQHFDRNKNVKGGGRGGGKQFQPRSNTTYVAETIPEEQDQETVDDEALEETYEGEGEEAAETADDDQAGDGAEEDDDSLANDSRSCKMFDRDCKETPRAYLGEEVQWSPKVNPAAKG